MSVAKEPGAGRVGRQIVAEEVAARIEELINSGKLAVGDKLPPERELARELRISRPTLREGIRALSAIGAVRVVHGKGTFITSRPSQARRGTAGSLHTPFTPAVLRRLQALLFAAAAAQAAARLDQAALDQLTGRLSAATGQGGPGALQELVGALRTDDADDRLGPLVELLWPEGADGAVAVGTELIRALAAKDPAAAFDAAFGTVLPGGG